MQISQFETAAVKRAIPKEGPSWRQLSGCTLFGSLVGHVASAASLVVNLFFHDKREKTSRFILVLLHRAALGRIEQHPGHFQLNLLSNFHLPSSIQEKVSQAEEKLRDNQQNLDSLRAEEECLSEDRLKLKEEKKTKNKAHKEQEVQCCWLSKATLPLLRPFLQNHCSLASNVYWVSLMCFYSVKIVLQVVYIRARNKLKQSEKEQSLLQERIDKAKNMWDRKSVV